MADTDNDLRLNELGRYRKQGSRLTLEVHSHCEVPAGCGGAVLRWRRPGAPIGLRVSTYVAVPHDGFCIDGQPAKEQRITLPPGDHVLSLVVESPGAGGFIMLRGDLDPHLPTAVRPQACSAADAHWAATIVEPSEGWRLPRFDASAFAPLVEAAVPNPSDKKRWSWEYLQKNCKGLGLGVNAPRTGVLGLFSAAPTRAWVRWSFHIDHMGFS